MTSQQLTSSLNNTLANAILFYQKLHFYHWEVAGDKFFELHGKFEEMYDQWKIIVDDVAERVLAVGGHPIPTLSTALKASSLREDETRPVARQMVANTLCDLETQHAQMREVIAQAEEAGDRTTVNLLDPITDDIEKTAWMFKAWLSD